jgi:protein phosphatase 1L
LQSFIKIFVNFISQAFYGVFDGHGGRAAVDFVSERLSKNVVSAVLAAAGKDTRCEASSSGDDDAVSAAIRAAYLATDSELLTQHQQVRTARQ